MIKKSPIFQVAEAAGLGDQVAAAGKQSRSEKKARKLFSKLGLKPVQGISRVCIRKSKVCGLSLHYAFVTSEHTLRYQSPRRVQVAGI